MDENPPSHVILLKTARRGAGTAIAAKDVISLYRRKSPPRRG